MIGYTKADPKVPYATEPGMIPCREVERRLNLTAGSLWAQRERYGVTVTTDWSGQHVVTVQDAARVVREVEAHWQRERARKRAGDMAKAARDAQAERAENERSERIYRSWTDRGYTPDAALVKTNGWETKDR
ncbi:hypothetical protein SAMN05421833_108212 [Microbispora rosea]|uniref:Uncharacterized protein n=1 Tax=Microbispora rosea TaxID=58117 RepID=A0A1N7AIP4_9ACTN|nr:hypothetical protein [Microbispora rosea]GIH51925.1 hypothetical protein Mro03_71040 [Microbispora rosea subsp. rosea]SIR38874.1 hypothetical protein SAMN05421833_108212 [Microbispora rosea]